MNSNREVPIGIPSKFTNDLYDALVLHGTAGSILTDEELNKIADGDCSPGGAKYTNLQSAIKKAERDAGIVWKREAKAGAIKCLNAEEVLDLSKQKMQSAARLSKRSLIRLASLDTKDVTPAVRHRLSVDCIIHQTIASASSRSTQQKLLARTPSKAPDVKRLLSAMISNGSE